MRYLVVNADDFGFSEGINRGIVEAHTQGVVTSASVMCHAPGFEDALQRLREHPSLDPGVHVTLTVGRPVSPPAQVATLVGPQSRFHGLYSFLSRLCVGAMNPDEVRREMRAQIEKFLRAGLRPSHLNSHHHVHLLPSLARMARDLAAEFGIPFLRCPYNVISASGLTARERVIQRLARRRRADFLEQGLLLPDNLIGPGLMGSRFEPHSVVASLNAAGDDTITELACHPGHVDDELASTDTYTHWREREVRVLISLKSDGRLAQSGVALTSFARLCKWRPSDTLTAQLG
ncbi:MAG: ChbG/HpnK family deacetylase [Planctomycetes bacterium]|nr:ChbG/HpnK family deacetylase [Planctomycetota bacterium]